MADKISDRAFWQKHFEDFRASGLSRNAYCREHGLKLHQFGYRLDRDNKASNEGIGFARVVAAPPVTGVQKGVMRLCFAGGVVLELGHGVDPSWIGQVIAAAGGAQ